MFLAAPWVNTDRIVCKRLSFESYGRGISSTSVMLKIKRWQKLIMENNKSAQCMTFLKTLGQLNNKFLDLEWHCRHVNSRISKIDCDSEALMKWTQQILYISSACLPIFMFAYISENSNAANYYMWTEILAEHFNGLWRSSLYGNGVSIENIAQRKQVHMHDQHRETGIRSGCICFWNRWIEGFGNGSSIPLTLQKWSFGYMDNGKEGLYNTTEILELGYILRVHLNRIPYRNDGSNMILSLSGYMKPLKCILSIKETCKTISKYHHVKIGNPLTNGTLHHRKAIKYIGTI